MSRIRRAPLHWNPSSKGCAVPNPVRKISVLLVMLALAMASCGSRSKTAPKQHEIGWRPVASWSGRGNTQTDSFYMDNGQWRIRWETSANQPPGTGPFQVIVHSTISGRFVEVAVDHQGAGSGIAYMAEEPRQFF